MFFFMLLYLVLVLIRPQDYPQWADLGLPLLPVTLADRADWEVHCLFATWLWTLIFAAWRPARQGWIDLATLAAIACAAVPAINLLTTDRHLVATVAHGDWRLAAVDLTLLGFGAAFGTLAWRLRRRAARQPLPAPRGGVDEASPA